MIVSENDLKKLVKEGLASRPDDQSIHVDITSIGLHLGPEFLRYKDNQHLVSLPSTIDVEQVHAKEDGAIDFPPKACILACSIERVRMPLDCMGFIQTKGTIARGFVTAHLCDGQIDPGFHGCITFELVNHSDIAYVLKPGILIAQLFIHRLTQAVERGYSGRYQNSNGPTAMRGETSANSPKSKKD